MSKIREDLDGVVYLPDGRKLSAGDTVPEGVELGEHVLAKSRPRAAAKGDGDKAGQPKSQTGDQGGAKGDGDNAAGDQS